MGDLRTVICQFCQCTMNVENDMDKVWKHMDKAHEVFFNTELWVAANFLNKEEIEKLISKIRPRIEMFIAEGKVNEQDNIFKHIPDELISQKPEPEIDAIQNLLQDENEDSTDSEDDEPLNDHPNEKNVSPNSEVARKEMVHSNVRSKIGKSNQKRKAAAGFGTHEDAVLGWLDSDEDGEDGMSYQINSTSQTDSKKTKPTTPVNTTKRSKLFAEWQEDTFRKYSAERNPENTVVDLEDEEKETLVNSVDDFIMSLQSQRKTV